jgi:hypothetical protein
MRDFLPNSSLCRMFDSPVRNLSKSARPARFGQQGLEKPVGNAFLGEPPSRDINSRRRFR